MGKRKTEKVDGKVAARILTEISQDKMGGWLGIDIPVREMRQIKSVARKIQENSKYLVCIGIGGSYLGHRAVIEAVRPKSPTEVIYAGNSLSTIETEKVLEKVGDEDFSVLVISKSGKTLEPAVAFEIFKEKLVKKYGKDEAVKRIFVTTDENSGLLHDEAIANGYTRFVIPESVGGRYSVFTAVGLLPMAVAGVKIDKLLEGAKECQEREVFSGKYSESAVFRYAFFRRFLYENGVKIEILASFEPCMMYFNEWWKQLFGESEGKRGGGMFPASVIYSTDLHSMGQYMQQGWRKITETVVKFTTFSEKNADYSEKMADSGKKSVKNELKVPKITVEGIVSLGVDEKIAGKSLEELNEIATTATIKAHRQGGIATTVIEMSWGVSEKSIGYLMYFFMVACAVSGKLNHINPFDQPGVEAYKSEMRKLL